MNSKIIYSLSLVLCGFVISHCTTPQNMTKRYTVNHPDAVNCIELIIRQDDSLGTVRNHACEKISLSRSIRQYVKAIEKLDFSQCPEAFALAFKNHIKAWKAMINLTNQFPHLRGEMHTLFDSIATGPHKEKFVPLLKAIWDTWAEVENAKQQ